MFKFENKKIGSLLALILLFAYSQVGAQVTPTNEWVSFYSDGNAMLNDNPLPEGSVIRVYDPDSVLCGIDTVDQTGDYGLVNVYRDDDNTPNVDEGAEPGDSLRFTINGRTAKALADSNYWTSNGDVIEMGIQLNTADLTFNTDLVDMGTIQLTDSSSTQFSLTNPGNKMLHVDSIKVNLQRGTNVMVLDQSFDVGEDQQKTVNLKSVPEFGKGDYEGSLTVYSNAYQRTVAMLPLELTIRTDVQPTNEWISIYSDGNTYLGDQLVQPDDMIDVYDPDGVHIGSYRVEEAGSYGLMSVYRDDPNTPEDEGAEVGDTLQFKINGYPANPTNTEAVVWSGNGEVEVVNLSANTNRSPVIESPLADITVNEGTDSTSVTNDVYSHFSDPEDDNLTFSVRAASDSVDLIMDNQFVYAEITDGFVGTTSLHLTADDGFSSTTMSLDLTVEAAAILESSHQSMRFDTTQVDSSKSKSMTIHNGGSLPLVISRMDMSTNHYSLAMAEDTLAPDSSEALSVTFEPKQSGLIRDTIKISHNGVESESHIMVRGVGEMAPASFRSSTNRVAFDTTFVDSSSTRQLTLHNDGGQTLTFSEIMLDNQAFSTNLTEDDSINAGSSMNVRITFSPASAGSFSDTLEIRHNGNNSPSRIAVSGESKENVGIEDEANLPDKFALNRNYPNPFNPSTNISYELPKASHVQLTVYNSVGRKVKTLVNDRKSAGRYNVRFKASNFPSGVYIYRLKAGSFTQTHKMILLK